MKQSIWVCTCVATGNNQTGVFIKYFRQELGFDSGINLHIADPESKVVIKSYIWKMTNQCGGYMYTCTVYTTLKI